MEFSHLVALALGLLPAVELSIPTEARAADAAPAPRVVEIVVRGGFQPARVEAAEGEALRLVFVRKESGGCAQEVVFPSLGIRKELPEGKPVEVQLPALKPGEYDFTCGMGMIKGKLVVRNHV